MGQGEDRKLVETDNRVGETEETNIKERIQENRQQSAGIKWGKEKEMEQRNTI